ncbi:MAG: c-type cytochrome [Chromatiales bacterium]|nr:c-type cytochrome [Chromatiales bacterium]
MHGYSKILPFVLSSVAIVAVPEIAAQTERGAEVVKISCTSCHGPGILGAPKLGVAEDWKERRAKGLDELVKRTIEGFNQMPPRGGNVNLSDADLRAAVEFILAGLDKHAETPAPAVAERPATVVEAKPAPKPTQRKQPVNNFNRLMKPASKRNPPPAADGIHDPQNAGTTILQHPKEAFSPMPKSNSGNRVDWVKALDAGDLNPRFVLDDPSKTAVTLDLNIVREVKGSMPDVVYPHKQHTEWLDCSNCHPAIFIPKKGANNISMAAILLGEKCGVCHGKVAFPVAECRKCHSKNKPKQ